MSQRFSPLVVAIFAQSLDGKIARTEQARPDFPSAFDYAHLQTQVASLDAVIMGSATLRAYGTSVRLQDPHLLVERQQRQQPPQPLTIICGGSIPLSPDLAFFRQPLRRWLWTTPRGAQLLSQEGFEQIWVSPDWDLGWRLEQLACQGIRRVGLLGGGRLLGAFLRARLVDELWITLCPYLLSGIPTAVSSITDWHGVAVWQLLEAIPSPAEELFLHYRLKEWLFE